MDAQIKKVHYHKEINDTAHRLKMARSHSARKREA
jgi:hypothetical protein